MVKAQQAHLKTKFIEAYKELWVIGKSAEAVGISRRVVYAWQDNDPDFKAEFDSAQNYVVEQMETEARRRAIEGVEEPVHYLGKRVDTVRKYSDTLLIFLLKGVAPKKYRESIKVSGDKEEPLVVHTYKQLVELAVEGKKEKEGKDEK